MRSRVPTVTQISWRQAIPPYAVLVAAVVLPSLYLGRFRSDVVIYGGAAFLLYTLISRLILAREHRRGMRHIRRADFEGAIPHFEESYRFFSDHAWVDRYRCLTMMTASAMNYREMALLNIAFCRTQLGDGVRGREYYERALREYPGSPIALVALKMMDSVRET